MSEEAALIHLQEQPVLCIRGAVPVASLGPAFGERLGALRAHLAHMGIQATGAPFVCYHAFGPDEADVELGVPIAQALPGGSEIRAGHLPGGPALVTDHFGPHKQLGAAYKRVHEAVAAGGFTPSGPAWEIYEWIDLNRPAGPDQAVAPHEGHTRLVQPVLAPVGDAGNARSESAGLRP